MDKDKAIRAAKLTLGGMLEKKRHTTAVSRADGQVSPSKYLPNVPRQVHAGGGKVAFMQGNHPDVPDVVYHGTNRDIRSFDPEAQRNYDIDPKRPDSTDTGWFGKGHYFAPRPKRASYYAEEAARRSQGKGAQVYPVHLSMKNPFVVNMRDSDSGATTLDKALNSVGVPMHPRGYRMPSEQTAALIGMGHDGVIAKREGKTEEIVAFHPNQIKSAIGNQGTFDPTDPDITKAAGGAANAPMFQGVHESLQDESGAPLDLYHGTTQPEEFEAFDDAKLGRRDAGFYGRGHYLSPSKENAEEYGEDGTVIGPLHAALKNPYVWDVSSDMKAHSTLRDLQSMGIMKEKSKLDFWDNLQSHHVQPFMAEMRKRGHDGVVVKTGAAHLPNGISEVVAFDPKTIKHTEAEAFDPTDPRIRREDGGKVAFQQGNHPDVPDVMYHGTGSEKDFSSFSMPGNKTGRKTGGNAIYLSTSPDVAGTFANYGAKPRIMPLHVSAKNPFDFRNPDHIDSLQGALTKNFKSWFPGAMYGPQTAVNWMRGGDFGLLENNNVRSWMKRQGHDSYFVTEGEGRPLNLAVLDPKQVKSAIGNNGDFDPTNPDITKSDGGEVESKRDFFNDNPGGEWLEGKKARAAQYPDDKFMVGATTGVIGGRSSMFLPTHVLKGIAGLNDEVRTSGVHKYDSLLSDARDGGFDPDQKGNKVVVAVNHYGQPYLLEGNTRVAVAHSMGIPKVKAEVRYWNGAENVDGPMHPEKVFGMASDNPDITKADGGEVTDSDNFRNWFGNSVTHTDGKPHVFYTGTSKDKDFTSHNVGRHGAWFVRDSAVASEYAEQNDSQGYKRDGWEITKTNTASRVIPAYVKAENPYTGDLPQEVLRDNYKAAQSEWFDTLRAKGHDSWIPASQNGNLVVALKEPQQIKSIFNSGKFDPNQKHMNKAAGGAAMGYVPMAALPVGRLALAKAPIQQPQGGVGQFSGSLSSLMDTVKGFKEKPEDVKSQTSSPLQGEAAVPSAATEGHSPQETGGMSEEALAAYGKLQDAYGQPLNVVSTYRDPQKNQDVGGAKGSQHLHGNAYDIDVSNMSYEDRLALADLAWNSGFRGIGFYDNSLHFDVGDPRSWGPSHSRDSIPEWAQPFTQERYGYSDGGIAMDDNSQDTSGGNNVESLSLARSLRNIGSGGGDDRVQGLFEKIAAGQQQAQKAYEMAHSNGEFDDFKIGDTFVYKHSKYPTPMKVTGFSVSRAEAFPQRKRIYNNHVPVLEMENQDAEKKVNKYPVEWFQENLHKYDFVSGKPRAVKAGGGAMDDSGQNGAMENGNAPINFETRPQAGGFPNAGGVRGSSGVLQAQDEAPLEGLPTKIGIPLSGQSVTAGPDPRIRQVARDYMASTGMKYNPPTKYAKVDPIRARRIAASYEGMKDDPNDPLTKASYDAMIKETMAQYNHAKKAGLKVEFWNPENQEDPYGASPRLATEDVRKNHHMWVFPTYAGYGSGDPISEDDAKKNPLLQLTGETWNGIPVTVNDVFRAVHDYYGHAKEGVGFRADGEENAWRSHASMYSPLARMAMTSETRGQNSWLNYGPHGEKNRNARTEDTIFAPQKIGVMPHWAHHEGAEDFTLPEDVEAMQRIRSNFDPAVSKALALTRRFTKGGESAINTLKSKGK